MMAERYGFTADEVGAMTLRQIKVYLMSTEISVNEAHERALQTEVARKAFIAAYRE